MLSGPSRWKLKSRQQDQSQTTQPPGEFNSSHPYFSSSGRRYAESPAPLNLQHGQTSVDGPGINIIEATPPVGRLNSIREGDTPTTASPPGANSRQASASSLNVDPTPRRNTTTTRTTELDAQEGWYQAIEQAVQRDEELVEEWKGAMDVLLIFATLFGAIITAFLVENYRDLKGDDANTTAYLSIIASTLNAPGIPPPLEVSAGPSSRSKRVNRLWFASLSITIGSAVFAMLAKQWVAEYSEGLGSDSPRDASDGRLHREARLREFRFAGVKKWFVPEIIGALPILLHVALFIFEVGLVDFFWELDNITSIVILAFVAVTSFLYLLSAALPAIVDDCPYKTPLSHLLANGLRSLHAMRNPSLRRERKVKALEVIDVDPDHEKSIIRAFTGGALAENEKKAVEQKKTVLDEEFLIWIQHSTRSESVAAWADDEIQDMKNNPKHSGRRPWKTNSRLPNARDVEEGPRPNEAPSAFQGESGVRGSVSERLNRQYGGGPLLPTAQTQSAPPRYNVKSPPPLPPQADATSSRQRPDRAPALAHPQPRREREVVDLVHAQGLGLMPEGGPGEGGAQV